MGSNISELEPKKVFGFFDEITKIPRSSGNEKAISDYLVDFASRRGLIAYQDELYNVTILKPSTSGMEEKPTIILQAHMDMVCVAAEGMSVDFSKDPIDAYEEDGAVKARGTSLGADDGIGMAFILAVLDSDDIRHPMIEAVFTTDEEVGLGGVNGYDSSRLKGKRLINLDSEEEDRLVIGCAGGVRCDLASKCKNGKAEGNIYEVTISNLTGGHSGTEIDKGSANANVLMGRLLARVSEEAEFNIVTYEGGTKDNAICTAAKATVLVKKKNGKAFEKCVKSFAEEVAAEYCSTDPDMSIKCKDKGKAKKEVMSTKDSARFIALLNTLPNGVEKMSQITDMVETSSNIGVATARPKNYCIRINIRSNRDAALEWMIKRVRMLADAFGVQYEESGKYPVWEGERSAFVETAVEKYKGLFGREIAPVTIHAGLECAVLAEKIKGLEAISIGPDLKDVHTVSETLSVGSTGRTWKYLLELLGS